LVENLKIALVLTVFRVTTSLISTKNIIFVRRAFDGAIVMSEVFMILRTVITFLDGGADRVRRNERYGALLTRTDRNKRAYCYRIIM